eukprot:7047952-Pyramimonas_sp.AAC.1
MQEKNCNAGLRKPGSANRRGRPAAASGSTKPASARGGLRRILQDPAPWLTPACTDPRLSGETPSL